MTPRCSCGLWRILGTRRPPFERFPNHVRHDEVLDGKLALNPIMETDGYLNRQPLRLFPVSCLTILNPVIDTARTRFSGRLLPNSIFFIGLGTV